jgi:hypothetical protein
MAAVRNSHLGFDFMDHSKKKCVKYGEELDYKHTSTSHVKCFFQSSQLEK